MNGWMRLSAASAALALAACGPLHRSVVVESAARTAPGPATGPVHSAARGGSYRVARGDTLYAIAFRTGVDFRNLAHWNGIVAPYTIRPGQMLRLSPPGRTMAARRHPAGPARAALPAGERSTPSASGFQSANTAAVLPAAPVAVPVAGAPVVVPVAAMTPASPVPRGANRSVGGVAWRWPADGSLIKRFVSGDAIPGIELAGKSGDPVRAAADGVVVYSGNGLVGYGELVIIKHNDSFLSAYGHNRRRLVKEGQRVSAGQQIAELGSTGASREELQFQIRRDGNPVDPMDYLPPR